MSEYAKLQVLFTTAISATASPYTRKLFEALTWTMPEYTGLSGTSIADGTLLKQLGQQDIANGRLLILLSDQEIEVRINGSGNDPTTGTFWVYVADETIGITSVHVSNTSGSIANIKWYIGGDIT